MKSFSEFQRRLQAGHIVVTGEIAPPRGASRATVERLALGLRDAVDAINLTDNQRGLGRMSALGAGIIVRQLGLEPIVQMTCQHRNRIALQADVLSGAACGITNFLAMTGDHPKIGDHPDAKNVLDLNSFQLLKMLRTMRDEGKFQSGVALTEAPRFFLGSNARSSSAQSSSRRRSCSTLIASASGWQTHAPPDCINRRIFLPASWWSNRRNRRASCATICRVRACPNG